MNIAGEFSFNKGAAYLAKNHQNLLDEIYGIITRVDAAPCKTKTSREKTMPGKMLYSPFALNRAFKAEFKALGWNNCKVACAYPIKFYKPGYNAEPLAKGAFREMDFVKEKLGIEVQFGKYAFMVYNVCAKMTIFHKLGHIDAGIEIVPIKRFADQMSTGVSYFEQFVWDLQHRGVSDIDIPVLIIGIDP
ncbi:MAG: restriction endonuclease [Verrucomicrobiota bacterium]|nr:restriction endonuclease [Verrucomicrobiota bacterium]